jgi:Arc/MetJ-type ribon-helix-helix transcriptional regulator
MGKPSVKIPDDVQQQLDDEILELKGEDKLPDKRMRSKVITEMIRDWLELEDREAWAEEHGLAPDTEDDSGNPIPATAD